MSAEWDDVLPTDRPMCFRFGSGAFPCGEPYKVRVTKSTRVNPRREVVTRRVVCRGHYDQATGATPNGSSIKLTAKNDAFARLAAAHRDEFQTLYVEALARLGVTPDGSRMDAS